MSYMKYILEVIHKNIIKSSLLILSIISFYVFFNTENITVKNEFKFIKMFRYNSEVHVIDAIYNASVRTIEDDDIIKGNKVIYESEVWDNWATAGFWIGIISLSLSLFIAVIYESKYAWHFRDIYEYQLLKNVKMNKENNIYYYHYKNRLIRESNIQINSGSLIYNVLECEKFPNLYEEIKPYISKVREKRLERINNKLKLNSNYGKL